MTDTQPIEHNGLVLELTSKIVAAMASNPNNKDFDVEQAVSNTFASLMSAVDSNGPPAEPAVPIKSSVKANYIVCLEDGKKLKMLKRHLSTKFGLTPDEYRAKWGLNSDYPMVAPSYSEKRRSLAKEIGLGRKKASPKKKAKTRAKAKA